MNLRKSRSNDSQEYFDIEGRALYEAFWKRNGGQFPEWIAQAEAICLMWRNIAKDAYAIYEQAILNDGEGE